MAAVDFETATSFIKPDKSIALRVSGIGFLKDFAAEGNTQALKLIEFELSNPEPLVKAAAICAVGSLKVYEHWRLTVESLRERNPNVRTAATEALGSFVQGSPVEVLLKMKRFLTKGKKLLKNRLHSGENVGFLIVGYERLLENISLRIEGMRSAIGLGVIQPTQPPITPARRQTR